MGYFDLRYIISLSFIFFSISFFYQSNFTTQVDLSTIVSTRLLQGFGVAIFFLPLVQLTLSEIPKERYASASGLFNFIRILIGSGFGTSLWIQLWIRLEIFYHARLADSMTTSHPMVAEFYQQMKISNPIFSPEVTTVILDKQVEQQAFMLSTNDLAWLSGWLCLSLIPFVFLCKRTKSHQSMQEVAH